MAQMLERKVAAAKMDSGEAAKLHKSLMEEHGKKKGAEVPWNPKEYNVFNPANVRLLKNHRFRGIPPLASAQVKATSKMNGRLNYAYSKDMAKVKGGKTDMDNCLVSPLQIWKQRSTGCISFRVPLHCERVCAAGVNCVAQSIFMAAMLKNLRNSHGNSPAIYMVSFTAQVTAMQELRADRLTELNGRKQVAQGTLW